jgi:hypothetical protein
VETFRNHPFFARRRKGFDRQAALDWWNDRQGGEPPVPGR